MVELAEDALTFNRVSKDDIDFVRMVKINERSIYSLERSNEDTQNPNSACEVAWSYRFVNNPDDYAVVKVLSSFLEEPTFNTLRTKEQLGYIVRASLSTQLRLLKFKILIQSSVKDADFLEHRINEFLANLKYSWDPT